MEIRFSKKQYKGYVAVVTTNPILSRVENGMNYSDYAAGFGNHNYGCNLLFHNDEAENNFNLLITWREVLDGRQDGIQLWRSGSSFRNVYQKFCDRRKTNQGTIAVFNRLFPEVYGDRIQCMHLIHCYYRSTIIMQQKYITECESRIKSYAPIKMHGQPYEEFLKKCDNVFELAIKKPYYDYVVIGSPIISRDTISSLVDLYITSMPTHFDTFFDLLGFKFKSNLTKNKHLTQTGFYKRQVFYNMLAMARQKNPQQMKHWAMISAGANYGRGIGEIVNRRATYLGASTTTQTFIRTVRPFGDAMTANVTKTLEQVDKTVWMLDNNQRGHPLKFQRFGSSNNFVKVTGRSSRQCTLCETDVGEENTKHCVLTYVNQAIPNPINFPNFDLEITYEASLDEIHRCMIREISTCTSTIKVDITGVRVKNYIMLHNIASTIKDTLCPLLTGYNKTTDKYKSWRNQPSQYITMERKSIAKQLHTDTINMSLYGKFQEKVVKQWNPRSVEATALLIPPVSLRDEIKTDGYGMAIIEILCLSGILIKVKVYGDTYAWELNPKWNEKSVSLHGWSIP